MYNEKRKEEFIASYTNRPKSAYYARAIFKKFEQYEENVWNDDLCIQSTEALEAIINSQTGTRMESAERALILLREYVKWCARNGFKTSDGIFGVKVNVVETVKKQMVGNPAQLQAKLDKVFTAESEKTIDCLYRAYVWMAYAGLTDKEALEVEIDEVDFDSLVIRHKEKVYRLYEEAKETFKQACTLKEFRYIHASENGVDYITERNRYNSKKIMSGIRGVIKTSTLRSILTKRPLEAVNAKEKDCTDVEPIKLSYKKIYYSGIFFRTYQNEVRGLGVRFSDYVYEEMANKQYTLNKNRTKNKIVNEMIRQLEVDYDRWKCAFSI